VRYLLGKFDVGILNFEKQNLNTFIYPVPLTSSSVLAYELTVPLQIKVY
jgi:hypothetical protein